MKADVLPTWSVKLVLELGPEEWECLPKGNGSRDGGFRGMHQRQPCQKMSPLWTGLITRVTALAQAKCSWSHSWPSAFSSWVYSISSAGMRWRWVWLNQLCSCISETRGLGRGLRGRRGISRNKDQFLCLVVGRSAKDSLFPPSLGRLERSHDFWVAFSFWRHTHTAFACRFVFSGSH